MVMHYSLGNQERYHGRTTMYPCPVFREASTFGLVSEAGRPGCRDLWDRHRSFRILVSALNSQMAKEFAYVTHQLYTVPAATACSG